jgi:hypothetical protein
MYRVIGTFLFFMSILLMAWGKFQHHYSLSSCSYHHKIPRVQNVGFSSILGDIVPAGGHPPPLNWNDKFMEDMGEKVGWMLSAEASHN